jgi:Transposase DDE domain
MASSSKARRLRPAARSLLDSLRNFLTPALWKQAHRARAARRASPRWAAQPLILTLLVLTWSCGDSQEERFSTARAFVAASLPKRRRPGATARGFHQALARLPMPALRAVAAALRCCLARRLARRWAVDGFIPLGCDGTRLACPRSAELERRLGQAGKPHSAPMLWLTALVHLRLGVPWAWHWGKGTASERAHLLHLLPLLPAAALVVADAGYVGYDVARALVEAQVCFLIRASSQATLYTARRVRPERFGEGEVYYGPGAKQRGAAGKPLLRLRLIRVRSRKKGGDVWLLTNVHAPPRLSAAAAAQLYRWRWESEGLFRTYKRTLAKLKLHSRTVRLVHREAEGSLLAAQLLLAQGALAMPRPGAAREAVACSPRKVLLAIRDELRGEGGGRFGQRLRRAQREQRARRSAKVKRPWPQRKGHKPPKPPIILKLTDAQKARIARLDNEAA